MVLRVPLPAASIDCRDLCVLPKEQPKKNWVGLKIEFKGTHPVDDLQVTPLTGNTFCNSTLSATVQNLTKDDDTGTAKALVTTDSGSCVESCAVTLPYSIAELDVQIDMPPNDAQMHARGDIWTLKCGGNATGYVVFSFPLAPSVCSIVVSPFD